MTTEITLHDRIVAIQAELKAPKGQYNSFGKYKYRSAEDILEAVKPLLKKHGCKLTIMDEIVLVGDRYYVKAIPTISDGSQSLSVCGWAREAETKTGMDASQITGTASSYARKYALNGLFCIDDTKDADTDENHLETEARAKAAPARKPKRMTSAGFDRMVKAAADGKTVDGVAIRDWYVREYAPTEADLARFDSAVEVIRTAVAAAEKDREGRI